MRDLEEWQKNIRSKDRFENANAHLNAESQSNSVISTTHFDGKQTLTLDSKTVSQAESKAVSHTETKPSTNRTISQAESKAVSHTETKTSTNTYQFADFDKLYNPYKVDSNFL